MSFLSRCAVVLLNRGWEGRAPRYVLRTSGAVRGQVLFFDVFRATRGKSKSCFSMQTRASTRRGSGETAPVFRRPRSRARHPLQGIANASPTGSLGVVRVFTLLHRGTGGRRLDSRGTPPVLGFVVANRRTRVVVGRATHRIARPIALGALASARERTVGGVI